LKLARFSVALATLLGNVDESCENIIITKEIVDYVISYFNRIYDNPIFKLHEYKQEYESYNDVTSSEIKTLQNMYARNAVLLDHLMSISTTTTINLRVVSGLENTAFNVVFASLVKAKFIKLAGNSVFPTPKFRKAMEQIDKSFRVDTGTMTYDTGLTHPIVKKEGD